MAVIKIEAIIDLEHHNYSTSDIKEALTELAAKCGYNARLVAHLVQEMSKTYD